MALAAAIQVKISSEAAEAVALTPVVVREMPTIELMEHLAAAAAADPTRIRELLKRGSLVSGASRFRWQPIDASIEEVTTIFQQLPAPDPARAFDTARCVRVALVAGPRRWELSRAAASSRGFVQRLLQRPSFWTRALAVSPEPLYLTYSYRDRADLFRCDIDDSTRPAVLSAAALLPYPALRAEIAAARLTTIEWFVER